MIKVRFNGVAHYLPTKVEDVTLEQYQGLMQCVLEERTGYIDVLACLLGLTVTQVANSEGNAQDFAYGMDALFSDLSTLHSNDAPESFTLTERTLSKPKDWGLHTLGQRIAFQNIAQEGLAHNNLHKFLAVLFAPAIYGKDWMDNTELLGEEFKQCRAIDAVPTAFFFIRKQMNMKKDGTIKYSSLLMTLIRKRGAKSLRSTDFLM